MNTISKQIATLALGTLGIAALVVGIYQLCKKYLGKDNEPDKEPMKPEEEV